MNSPSSNDGQSISLKRRVFSIPTMVSFVVAAMFLVFLVTSFDIDLEAIWDMLKASNLYLYGLAFASYYAGFIFRGMRWQIMLRSASDADGISVEVPSVLACSRYIFLGWFANAITWFRLGDAYRAYVFTDATGYNFARTIGTILAERVLDVVMIFILIVAAALALYGVSDLGGTALFLVIASLLVLASVAVLFVMKQFGMRLARFLPARIRTSYDRFHQGALGSFRHLPLLLFISFLTWFTEVGRLYFVMQALDISVAVSFSLILFVTLANAILTTVPITPGGLGIVEPGIIGLLTLSLARSEAVSVALLDRSISYLSIVVFGGVVFLLYQASRNRTVSVLTKSSGDDINRNNL
jgi:hypothetical protein